MKLGKEKLINKKQGKLKTSPSLEIPKVKETKKENKLRFLYYVNGPETLGMGRYQFTKNKITQVIETDADKLINKNKLIQLQELSYDDLKTTSMELLPIEQSIVTLLMHSC